MTEPVKLVRAATDPLASRLGAFIAFERDVRAAIDRDALAMVVCNTFARVLSNDVAILLAPRRGRDRVVCVSGVSDFDSEAPIVTLAERHCAPAPDAIDAEWNELGLDAVLRIPLADQGALLVLRKAPFREAERRIALEAGEVVAHALRTLSPARGGDRLGGRYLRESPLLRRGAVAAALIALTLLPVRQSVLAQAEIIPARPDVVAAGMDGVIRDILVAPSERVTRGQLLVRLDDSELQHERRRTEAELDLLREQRREAGQSTLGRRDGGARLARLDAQIDLKALDLSFLDERLERVEIRAGDDGVAMFSREQDWLGRAVRTGDRIMEVAVDAERRIEAWVAVNDAIELGDGDALRFFPDAFPLDTLDGTVDTVSFFARRDDAQALAYRVVADLENATDEAARLGMKGSVRLYGERVALGYYLLRKPAAAARRWVGI